MLKGKPIWMWMYLSPLILPVLFIQYIYMVLLIIISFRALKIKMKREVMIRTITMAWILSFISQFAGLMILQIAHIFIRDMDLFHIYSNVVSISFHLSAILFSGLVCYCLLRYLFQRVAIFEEASLKMAVFISFMTSPWLFLVPIASQY